MQTLHNVVSDQDLHYLLNECYITIWGKKIGIPPNTPKIGNGLILLIRIVKSIWLKTWPRSAVGNVSCNRCVSDCNFRGREFDPGPVPYFRGD